MSPKKLKLKSKTGNYWLVKSEPDVFSIDDLASAPNQTTHWDGVRNYQARNTLRDQMKKGDYVLFYHSSSSPTAIVGVAQVVREGYPDFTAFDRKHAHFDPKSRQEQPTWFMVDIQMVHRFSRPINLDQLRSMPGLSKMVLLQKGSRLSVQPVRSTEFDMIMAMADA